MGAAAIFLAALFSIVLIETSNKNVIEKEEYIQKLKNDGYVICYVDDDYFWGDYIAGISKDDYKNFQSGTAKTITIRKLKNSDYSKEEIIVRPVTKINSISVEWDKE